MIMRLRVIPDNLALSNGRRTTSTSNPTWKTGKEDEDREESNNCLILATKTSSTFEGKGISRFRSPSKASQENHSGNGNTVAEAEDPNSPPTASDGVVKGGGNDTFLQWGHRKRSRCSRGMALTDETSSSTTSTLQPSKLQRRLLPHSSLPNSNVNAMPPPSQPSTNGVSRVPNLRTPTKNNSSSPAPIRRNLEERSLVGSKSPSSNSGGGSRAASSRSRVGKKIPSADKKTNPTPPFSAPARARDEKMNGGCSLVQQEVVAAGGTNHDSNLNENNGGGRPPAAKVGGGEKVNNSGGSEVNEWPRIYIPLSRKEKEEDFLAMKGTKLPHRPKKRPKTVDRMLQYCFPGMWLSDLTRGRYEVREKKCPKKQKRRGLKGMESLESDSE